MRSAVSSALLAILALLPAFSDALTPAGGGRTLTPAPVVGLFQVSSITTTGGSNDLPIYTTSPTLSGISPTAEAEFSLPFYSYAADVTVCVTRVLDPLAPSAALGGAALLSVTIPGSVSDAIISVTNPGASTIAGSPSENYVSDSISAGAHFNLYWSSSELTNVAKCFTIQRTSWTTAGNALCSAAASWSVTLEMVQTGADALCGVSDASGCTRNDVYFIGGVSSIKFAALANSNPPVTLLSTATIAASHFSAGSGPPPLSQGVWATESTLELLGFERTCTDAVMAGAGDIQTLLWADTTSVTLSSLFSDVQMNLKSSLVFNDVTNYFKSGLHTTVTGLAWSTFVSRWPQSTATSIQWTGAECGPAHRKFVVVALNNGGAPLGGLGEAILGFSFTNAVGTGNGCQKTYANPAPSVQFIVRNVVATAGSDGNPIQLVTAHHEVFPCPGLTIDPSGALSGCIGIVAEDAAATIPAQHELVVITLGTGSIQDVNGNLSFYPNVLSHMCTNIPDNFMATVSAHGWGTTNDFFDGLWAGDWPTLSGVGDTYSWSKTHAFYPTSSNNPIFGNTWDVVTMNSGSGNSQYSGLKQFQLPFSGLLTDFESCLNADGSSAVVTTNDPEVGITKTLTFTIDRWTPNGPTTNRRVQKFATSTVTMQVQVSNTVNQAVASVVRQSIPIAASVLSTTLVYGSQDDCTYTMGATPNLDFDVVDHACDAGGTSAVYVAIQTTVLVRIARMATTLTDSDICILPPNNIPFSRADPTFQTSLNESCYGVVPTAGSATQVFGYTDDATMNTFRVTYVTPTVNLYSISKGAVDLGTFQSCLNSASANDFSIQLELMQPTARDVSCEHAFSTRTPLSGWRTYMFQEVSLTSPVGILPASTSVFNSHVAGWSNAVSALFKVPDYQTVGGAWATHADTAVSGDIVPLTSGNLNFQSQEWVAFTLKAEHAALVNEVELFIQNFAVSTLVETSPFAHCIDSSITGGTQYTCPSDPIIATSLDSNVWNSWLTLNDDNVGDNPIDVTYIYVSDYTPGAKWANAPTTQIQDGRWSVATAAAKSSAGSPLYFCEHHTDSAYRLGADSSAYSAAKLTGRVDSFWHHFSTLAGSSSTVTDGSNTQTAPFKAADGVAIPVAQLPVGKKLHFKLSAVYYDCANYGYGSRRLRELSTVAAPVVTSMYPQNSLGSFTIVSIVNSTVYGGVLTQTLTQQIADFIETPVGYATLAIISIIMILLAVLVTLGLRRLCCANCCLFCCSTSDGSKSSSV